jgi:hypothetical protein
MVASKIAGIKGKNWIFCTKTEHEFITRCACTWVYQIKLPFICLQVPFKAKISRFFKQRENCPGHITKQNWKMISKLLYSMWPAKTQRACQLTIVLYVCKQRETIWVVFGQPSQLPPSFQVESAASTKILVQAHFHHVWGVYWLGIVITSGLPFEAKYYIIQLTEQRINLMLIGSILPFPIFLLHPRPHFPKIPRN